MESVSLGEAPVSPVPLLEGGSIGTNRENHR